MVKGSLIYLQLTLKTVRKVYMSLFRSWGPWILFGLLWAGVRQLYILLQVNLQEKFLSSGLVLVWWGITSLYFLCDVALVLGFLHFTRRPLGKPVPKGFPIWYLMSDAIILVFLIHLALACTDSVVRRQLAAIGLSEAYALFIVAATVWALLSGMRYVSLRKRYL